MRHVKQRASSRAGGAGIGRHSLPNGGAPEQEERTVAPIAAVGHVEWRQSCENPGVLTIATSASACSLDGDIAIFAQLKPISGYRGECRQTTLIWNEGGIMKKVLMTATEPTTAALLIAVGIGLGIAVHPVFFLAALLIALAALIQSLINAAGHVRHRHP